MHHFVRNLACATALATAGLCVPQAASHAATAPLTPLGVTVGGLDGLRHDTALFGPLPVLHTYYRGLPPARAWQGVAGAAAAVVVTFSAPPATVLSGRDDAALLRFFRGAPAGHRVYYNYIHEPEHAVAHAGLNLPAYLRAWGHVAHLAARTGNPRLKATAILEEYDLKAGRNWRAYLPPGHVIQVLAWDAYPGVLGSAPQPPAQFLGPAIAASRAAGLPYGFTEFGLHPMAARAAWAAAVGTYLLHSGAVFATYFQAFSYQLATRAEVAAWRGSVQASR